MDRDLLKKLSQLSPEQQAAFKAEYKALRRTRLPMDHGPGSANEGAAIRLNQNFLALYGKYNIAPPEWLTRTTRPDYTKNPEYQKQLAALQKKYPPRMSSTQFNDPTQRRSANYDIELKQLNQAWENKTTQPPKPVAPAPKPVAPAPKPVAPAPKPVAPPAGTGQGYAAGGMAQLPSFGELRKIVAPQPPQQTTQPISQPTETEEQRARRLLGEDSNR